MTATITPVSQYDEATLTRAVAGERMRMDTGTAPLKDILQAFADRDKFALDALIATIGWSGDFSVDPGGSNSSFAVNVGAISAAVLAGASSGYKVFYATATTIGASKISGGGNLANSTWYYVYIWDNAGTLDYEISTTAPSSSRRTKTGDVTRRYLGCFRTTSAGAPIPVRASRGRYVYRRSGGAVADTRVLNAGTQTSATAVDCSALVPPHSRLATIHAEIVNTAGAINYGHLRTNGDAGADEITLALTNVNASTASGAYEIETDSSRNIAYYVSNNSSAPTLTLWVNGFCE